MGRANRSATEGKATNVIDARARFQRHRTLRPVPRASLTERELFIRKVVAILTEEEDGEPVTTATEARSIAQRLALGVEKHFA